MTDERLDFSALDPTADAERFDRVRGAIVARVAPRLRAWRARQVLWTQLAAWRRPVLAAAAAIVLASAAVIVRAPRQEPAARAQASQTLIEAAGVPESITSWEGATAPGPADVLDL